MTQSRRDFLDQGVLWGCSLWLALALPRPRAWAAAQGSAAPETFDAAQWRTVDA